MTHTPITPDLPIAEAGRLMMAEELATVHDFWPALTQAADVMAVHETRKAIRRSFTLFKLFAPYFAPEVLEPHRRALRGLMRRLAPCRDWAVFRLKLGEYNRTNTPLLLILAEAAEDQQIDVDARLRAYVVRPRVAKALRRYEALVTTPGAGLPDANARRAPLLVRHVLPALIFQHLATVRALGDTLPKVTPAQFHQLRIQFKELRYTLTYFEDILGETSGRIIEMTRLMQDNLGFLNDAIVAAGLLGAMTCCPDEVAIYGNFQQREMERLTQAFYPLYADFDRRDVRQVLALTVSSL